MAYGVLVDQRYLGSYTASATGYPTLTSVQPDLSLTKLSRSGVNGSYSKGGIAMMLTPILIMKKMPIGIKYVKRYRKVYYEVSYSYLRRVRVYRGNRSYYYKTVTVYKTKKKFYYQGYSEARTLYGLRPVRVYKYVPKAVQPYMVMGPHQLTTRAESILDNTQVDIQGKNLSNPSWSSSLICIGSIKCRLAEENSVIGFNAAEYSHSKVPGAFTSRLLTSARYKLVDKGQSSTVQLANAAIEANSLKNATADFLMDAIRTYISFKRGLKATLDPKIREKMSNQFFAWSWGIIPTINDIKSTASAMKQSVWRKYTASVSDTYTIADIYNTTRFKGAVYGDLRVTVRTGIIVTGTYGAAYLGKQISGGGAISTAYEAIPFSFAIDWLIPLGTYLAAPEVFPTSSVHSYYETVYIEGTIDGSGEIQKHDYVGRSYSGPGKYNFHKTVASCVRNTPSWNPTLPSPTLTTSGNRLRQLGYSILLTLQRLK